MSEVKQRNKNTGIGQVNDKSTKDEVSSRVKEPVERSDLFVVVLNLVKWLSLALIFGLSASYIVTETFTFGYSNKYTNWRTYIPRRMVTLTPDQLKKYDGSNPNLPLYIAIDGEVYDVSSGRGFYSKGGSYQFFAGRDAARAYVTGCFDTHLTHDKRGLSKSELEGIKGWQDFYKNHEKYFQVGYVKNPSIDPNSPIPADCNKGKSEKRDSKVAKKD